MISWIWSFLIGGFLIVHGLLHWRFDLSHSWLLTGAGLVGSQPIRSLSALLWMFATIGFAVTGLGVLGFPILHETWRTLAIISASFSLVLLVLAWHPWVMLGVLIDIGILVALL